MFNTSTIFFLNISITNKLFLFMMFRLHLIGQNLTNFSAGRSNFSLQKNSSTYMQARDLISHSFPYVLPSLPQTGNHIIGQIVIHFVLRACVVVIGSHVVARRK